MTVRCIKEEECPMFRTYKVGQICQAKQCGNGFLVYTEDGTSYTTFSKKEFKKTFELLSEERERKIDQILSEK